MKKELKLFDKVLARDNDSQTWILGEFHCTREGKYPYVVENYVCVDWYAQCIPYEGNEPLLGTNLSPSEDY